MNQSLNFIGLIFCLFLIVNVFGDACSPNNCQTPDKCDDFIRGNTCPTKGHSCCQSVKSEYRTMCDQSQGHCTKSNCPENIRIARERSIDCAKDENCCVLVI